jgi:hypothetical protein
MPYLVKLQRHRHGDQSGGAAVRRGAGWEPQQFPARLGYPIEPEFDRVADEVEQHLRKPSEDVATGAATSRRAGRPPTHPGVPASHRIDELAIHIMRKHTAYRKTATELLA